MPDDRPGPETEAEAAAGATSAYDLAMGSPETIALGLLEWGRAGLSMSRRFPGVFADLASQIAATDIAALESDRRFAHPAWRRNVPLRSLALHDVVRNGGMPALSRQDAYKVCSDLACTPGRVVHRSEVCELIQFTPEEARIRAVPLLMVPSPVNKYYLSDLAPGRSLVEACLEAGLQVFALSWAHPSYNQRHWGLDTYAAAAEESARAACEVTRTTPVNRLGVCAGGQVSAGLGALLADKRDLNVVASTFLVSGIDTSWSNALSRLSSPRGAEHTSRRVKRKGFVPGRDISRTFASLRAQQLIWGPWVNNYVLGNDPPEHGHPLLERRPHQPTGAAACRAAMDHGREPVRHTRPGEHPGRPVDLSSLTSDHYYVAGRDDHIVPWQSCYRSARLLGGGAQFVIASGGHIQGVVSPSNNKANYRSGQMNHRRTRRRG